MGILDLPTKDIFKNISWDDFSIFIKKSQISLVKMNGMFRTFLNCTNQDNPGYLITKKPGGSQPVISQPRISFKEYLEMIEIFSNHIPTIYQPYTNQKHCSTRHFMALRSPKNTTPSCCSYPQGIADTSSRLSLKRIMEQFGEAWVLRGSRRWAGDEKSIWLFCLEKIRGWDYDTTPASCGDSDLFLKKWILGLIGLDFFQESQGL